MSLTKKIQKIQRAGLAGLVALTLGCETTPQMQGIFNSLAIGAAQTAVTQKIKGKLNPDASNVNVNVYNDRPENREGQEEKLIDPFMCNHWEDYNKNSIPETNEMIGIKSKFKKNEQVTTGFYFRNMKGSQVSSKLIYPNGEFEESNFGKINYFHQWFCVRKPPYYFNDLGTYEREWFFDGEHIASQIFEIIE